MDGARERLSAAKLWLTAPQLGAMPYLSTALYAMPTVLTDAIPSLSCDEHWRVYANPDWVLASDVPALGAELAHHLWHLLRDHAGRARSMCVGKNESRYWSVAADLTVSGTLAAAGHPVSALPTPTSEGVPVDLAVEEYYTLLHRLSTTTEEHDLADCGSAADGIPRAYEVSDDSAVGETEGERLRRQVAISFHGHMGGRGSEAGEWARWVDQVLEPRIPWQQVLSASVRRAVAWTQGNTHLTYRRLSRRSSPGVVLPGTQRPVPAIAVVIDTSGSMDDGLLAQAVGEVDGVLRSLGNAVGGLQVYSCDAEAHNAGKVLSARALRLVGGGGTDLRVGIAAALQGRPKPEVVIVLTDGDTPWPSTRPEGCVVVAVLLTRRAAPACPSWATLVECNVA